MALIPFLKRLEAEGDEDGVRHRLAAKLYHSDHAAIAEEWLRSRERARQAEFEARAETREKEALEVSRNALDVAKDANRIASHQLGAARGAAEAARRQARWAMYAALIAAIMAVISVKDQPFALVFELIS